jgi:hypothetical protein
MLQDAWLDPLRSSPRFSAILAGIQTRHEEARRIFGEASGKAILGTA